MAVFVSSYYDMCIVFISAVQYTAMCYTWPCHNGNRQYLQEYWNHIIGNFLVLFFCHFFNVYLQFFLQRFIIVHSRLHHHKNVYLNYVDNDIQIQCPAFFSNLGNHQTTSWNVQKYFSSRPTCFTFHQHNIGTILMLGVWEVWSC